uniref:G protein-coupled receptor 101 n=1 Tax=Astyanax mexicanus TaxID=7994 RepID=W5KYM2_ASTMX
MDYNSSTVPWDPGTFQPPSLVNSALKMALISIIVCTSLFGNVVVLLVFQRKPQLLHVANRFVLNLLLADLLQTVLVMPFVIAAAAPGVWPLDARLCQALVVLMHLFAFAGVNTIIVVSVDRYLAIIHPLSYPTRMTPHLGTNLIALTWLLGLLQSTPPLYGWGTIDFDRRHNACTVVWSSSYSYSALVATLSFWLPVVIMLGCYWMVFRAARRQNALVHPIQSKQPPDSQAEVSNNSSWINSSSPIISSLTFNLFYHCKAARVVFVVMASYILGMGPYSVLSTVSIRSGASIPPWLASLALVLFFLQCCLHPYIYGYMHRSVRKEFLFWEFDPCPYSSHSPTYINRHFLSTCVSNNLSPTSCPSSSFMYLFIYLFSCSELLSGSSEFAPLLFSFSFSQGRGEILANMYFRSSHSVHHYRPVQTSCSFRLDQEQKWVSMAEELHPNLTSPIANHGSA